MGGLTVTNAIDPNKGERSHAGVAYLKPAMDRPNVEIITDALVEKIVFDPRYQSGLVANGVQYIKSGQQYIAKARREVIICAGAFQSPQIFELSGIGSKSILDSHGIVCLYDNPNVGGLTISPSGFFAFTKRQQRTYKTTSISVPQSRSTMAFKQTTLLVGILPSPKEPERPMNTTTAVHSLKAQPIVSPTSPSPSSRHPPKSTLSAPSSPAHPKHPHTSKPNTPSSPTIFSRPQARPSF